MIRTYEDALNYLKTREKFGIKFGLSNIANLTKQLGHPEFQFPSILIAGTNGKGSTAALLASILSAAGYRTGRYTSPHIRDVSERININSNPISDKDLVTAVANVHDATTTLEEPTFFETITAAAFYHFAKKKVDIAVLEVGMGGRWDATNIVPRTISVITSIGFDHERFLGNTLTAIAQEKAAIIQKGKPVVIGNLTQEALEVVIAKAKSSRAMLLHANEEVQLKATPSHYDQVIHLQTPKQDYGKFEFPLLGEHQLENLVLAVRVAELVDPTLSPSIVRKGVQATKWPGRLQRIPGAPEILLDAAHNVMAAEKLSQFLSSNPKKDRVLLFGVMKDKHAYGILRCLLPHARYLVATQPELSRAMAPKPIAEWSQLQGIPAESISCSYDALQRAKVLAKPQGEILVAGSIFLIGEIVKHLERTPSDVTQNKLFPLAAQTPSFNI